MTETKLDALPLESRALILKVAEATGVQVRPENTVEGILEAAAQFGATAREAHHALLALGNLLWNEGDILITRERARGCRCGSCTEYAVLTAEPHWNGTDWTTLRRERHGEGFEQAMAATPVVLPDTDRRRWPAE